MKTIIIYKTITKINRDEVANLTTLNYHMLIDQHMHFS